MQQCNFDILLSAIYYCYNNNTIVGIKHDQLYKIMVY